MAWRFHGRARVTINSLDSFAVCDRCGMWYNIKRDLHWQFEYAGPNLQNLHLLVCDTCLDIPQPQLIPRILPPDPLPTLNARPEKFWYDNNSYLSTTGTNAPTEPPNGDNIVTADGDNLIPSTESPPPLE